MGPMLGQHESSPEHCRNIGEWRDFQVRLAQGESIDAIEMALLEIEKKRCQNVLKNESV